MYGSFSLASMKFIPGSNILVFIHWANLSNILAFLQYCEDGSLLVTGLWYEFTYISSSSPYRKYSDGWICWCFNWDVLLFLHITTFWFEFISLFLIGISSFLSKLILFWRDFVEILDSIIFVWLEIPPLLSLYYLCF